MNNVIIPQWPAPPRVKAYATTRLGGVSAAPFDSLNLGTHVGDDPDIVNQNRNRLVQGLALPRQPLWLSQVHRTTVVNAATAAPDIESDGSYTTESGVVCAVMTADCLPVLFAADDGRVVGAAHAGWRGLAAGVLEATVEKLGHPAARLMAWLGPAIGPEAFEVGDEVRQTFVDAHSEAQAAFIAHGEGKWLADIYQLARLRLAGVGVTRVFGGGLCTYGDPQRFYSFRRDGKTGRMASLIYLSD